MEGRRGGWEEGEKSEEETKNKAVQQVVKSTLKKTKLEESQYQALKCGQPTQWDKNLCQLYMEVTIQI